MLLKSLVTYKKGKKPETLIEINKEGFSPYILIDQMEGKPVKYYTNDNCPRATKDDILLVWDGSIGKNATNLEGVIGSTIMCITPKDEIIKEYLHYFIQYAKPIILAHPKGSGLAHINPDIFWNLDLPVYDKDQQKLIISEIEKQFSRLDEGLSSLMRIRENLKSYRASLLKSAVEGRLTAEWRAEHPDIESADILLDRIRTARREKWLSENPGKKYKEKLEIKEEGFSIDIPNLWINTTLGLIADSISTGPFGTMLHKSDYISNGIPLINPANIVNGKIIPDHRNTIDTKTAERLETYILKEGDIVIGRRGEMGRCAMVTEVENGWLCGTGSFFMRLSKYIDRRFFMTFFTSNSSLQYLNRNSIGTTMNNLNSKILTSMPIALPPLLEQHRIVEILEEKFSVIDSLESLIDANIRRAENLKQAILKKTFSGELISK